MAAKMAGIMTWWAVPALALALAAGCAVDATPGGVFKRTCSRCHDLELPLRLDFSPELWRPVVAAMSDHAVKRFGAPIPEADQKVIVEYLAANAGRK